MTVSLFLFGPPTVEYGGESVALPFERRNQLLVFLALKRAWVGRSELAALLWPEQENKLAYTNLRKILHRLQSLPWARGIESQGGALRFEAETDVFAFESALREQRIADALPMRRGELLAGFDDDQSEAWSSWLNFERDRLRVAWRDAALNRLAPTSMRQRALICRSGFSTRTRLMKLPCARTCPGWRERPKRACASGVSRVCSSTRRRSRACARSRTARAARFARHARLAGSPLQRQHDVRKTGR